MSRRRHLLCGLVAALLGVAVWGCGDVEDEEQDVNEQEVEAEVDAPTDVTASDATSADHVVVGWEPVDGADKYLVYRDGERIDEVGHGDDGQRHEIADGNAEPAGPPETPTEVEAVWELDFVEVSWEPAQTTIGPEHEYVVVAANGDILSDDSEPAQGRRDGEDISHYEIEIEGLGYFFDVGDQTHWIDDETSSELMDEDVDKPTLIGGDLDGQQSVSLNYVELQAEEPTIEPGGAVSYRVRAVDGAGRSSEPSEAVVPTTVIGGYELQWQRSEGDDPQGPFEDLDLDCADELECQDPVVSSRGESRFYRVRWTTAETVYSDPPLEVVIDPCDPAEGPFGAGDGSEQSPWRICSVDHLAEMSGDESSLDDYFQFSTDLFVDDDAPPMEAVVTSSFYEFEGVVLGGGFTIYDLDNLVAPFSNSGVVSLFGFIGEDGHIQNLNIENAHIETGNEDIAILASENHGTIVNVSVSGTIEPTDPYDEPDGYIEVGGVVGENGSSGELIDVHADVDIDVEVSSSDLWVQVGGVAAQNRGAMIRTSSSGDITAHGAATVGGLVGDNRGDVEESRSTGSATGTGWVGGLVGTNNEVVRDSYSGTTVEGELEGNLDGEDGFGGGLVGHMDFSGEVEDSYASGLVDVDGGSVGGLIGGTRVSSFQGDVTNSYWDTDTSQVSESFEGESRTTGEFGDENNFEDWDFDEIWTMGTDGDGDDRPVLQWE